MIIIKRNHRRTYVNLDDRPFDSFCLRTQLNAKAFDNCYGNQLFCYLVVSYLSRDPRSIQKRLYLWISRTLVEDRSIFIVNTSLIQHLHSEHNLILSVSHLPEY